MIPNEHNNTLLYIQLFCTVYTVQLRVHCLGNSTRICTTGLKPTQPFLNILQGTNILRLFTIDSSFLRSLMFSLWKIVKKYWIGYHSKNLNIRYHTNNLNIRYHSKILNIKYHTKNLNIKYHFKNLNIRYHTNNLNIRYHSKT